MKIIDLLNKIANGEEVPKQIKYIDWLYDWDENAKDYRCGNDWLEDRDLYDFKTFLNDEVEIIEEEPRDIEVCGSWFTKTEYDKLAKEDKKIEKLENEIEFYSYSKYEELKNDIDKVLYILKAINLVENKISNLNNKINEIIDILNKGVDK